MQQQSAQNTTLVLQKIVSHVSTQMAVQQEVLIGKFNETLGEFGDMLVEDVGEAAARSPRARAQTEREDSHSHRRGGPRLSEKQDEGDESEDEKTTEVVVGARESASAAVRALTATASAKIHRHDKRASELVEHERDLRDNSV